jgi:competence protein CoiA
MWHWAHLGVRKCDAWWEPETSWHRNWKSYFPIGCQEVRHSGSDGEVHIADVRTKSGAVLEFQHSNISREERGARERFYSPMMWVVDGRRLLRDLPTFGEALTRAEIYDRSPICLIMPLRGVPIAQRWADSTCPVYLDFGDAEFILPEQIKGPVLWRLAMSKLAGYFTATPILRRSFIEHHISNVPMRGYGLRPHPSARPNPLRGFEAYMAELERRRWRF